MLAGAGGWRRLAFASLPRGGGRRQVTDARRSNSGNRVTATVAADPGGRYWAFLSYSHADQRIARRLHRALEEYRLPRRLVGRAGPLGIVPRRLHPIFRDRDELTASGHIGAVVEAALQGSRALVVLCSKASAGSPWVGAEVAAFQRLHEDAPVLCVLLDGEPMASLRGEPLAECVPQPLHARFGGGVGLDDHAPVAVDLRPQGEGWRLGVQKLVAGLAGVPLGQLVQRDAQRRHRRLAALAGVLALIAIALGTMAVFALRSRDEARRERAQAESLIEFMLGDLRKKLDPVGRLDAMDAVGARALRYYDAQDPRRLDADALGRRARSQQLVGEIDARRGDMPAALSAFREARATTAELLARAPDNPQRIFEHAQSVYWVGYYDWQHGELPIAEQSMLEYQRLARRLVAIDPRNMKWQGELAYAHSDLGVMLLDAGRTREALAEFEAARPIYARRVAADSGDDSAKTDLGQDLSWLSSAESLELDFAKASRVREAEIDLYQQMLRHDPRNATVSSSLVLARRFLASLRLAQGDLGAARVAAEDANRLADQQLRLEPDNADWQQAAANARLVLSEVLRWQGQSQSAQAVLDRTTPLVAGLLRRDPTVFAWRVELQESQSQLQSDLWRATGRREAALRLATESARRLQQAERDPAVRTKTERWWLLSLGRVARLSSELGDAPAARAAWQALVQAGARNPTLNAEGLLWLARAYQAQGDIERSEQLLVRLRNAGYRHPEFTGAQASDFIPDRNPGSPRASARPAHG